MSVSLRIKALENLKENYLLKSSITELEIKLKHNLHILNPEIDINHLLHLRQKLDTLSSNQYVHWVEHEKALELINALPKDGVFIDIGANIGLYTLVAAEVMGDNGRILAFEPGSLTLQSLSINLEANHKDNGRPNIQVLNVGVADENGDSKMKP